MLERIHLARFLPEATNEFEAYHFRADSRENIYCFSANAATCVLAMLEPMLRHTITHYEEKPDLGSYNKLD